MSVRPERRCPAFMVFGTPRSGTTLVQRLACELEGVRVPPETHFFSLFLPSFLQRRRFPLDAAGIRDAAASFVAMPTSEGVQLDGDRLVERLDGGCETPGDLFSALLEQLTYEAPVPGEKTTDHLSWWRQLASAFPRCRFVAVVRDPRAVLASTLRVDWGMRSVAANAERWLQDQRDVVAAQRSLGPERVLVLRYEDVVADPDAARSSIARLLGLPDRASEATAGPLFHPWERWKEGVHGPVRDDRVAAWRAALTPMDRWRVEAITAPMAVMFGYPVAPAWRRCLALATLSPAERFRRVHLRIARRRKRRAIERTSLGDVSAIPAGEVATQPGGEGGVVVREPREEVSSQ